MFTDPENYNRDTQRESERDFLPFEESFNKNQNKNNYKIIQNNPNNTPSFGQTNINNSKTLNIKKNTN